MEYDIVKREITKGISTEDNPNIQYIVGQTGSGKTSLMQKKSSEGNYVIIDNDLWRGYYPNYIEIITKYKTDEIPEILETMKEWRSKLVQQLTSEHYNLIIHTSMTNPNEISEQIKRFKDNGYNISIAAIACNEYISRLRGCIRYVASILR